MTLPTNFTNKIDYSGDHWLWIGATQTQGYGSFGYEGKSHLAHRWSYEQLIGPIPEGMVIDHLCRVRSCVNPAHMEVVTPEENNTRGHQARGWFCRFGHDLQEVGTYERRRETGEVTNECLACRAIARKRHQDRERGTKHVCDDCGQMRAKRARGLCTTCYARHRDAGTLPTKLRERTSV